MGEISCFASLLDETGKQGTAALEQVLRDSTGSCSDQLLWRVQNFLSATPGFDFAMKHKVPPMFPQSIYLVQLDRAVRVGWYAYVVDQPKPGLTCSSVAVALVTEDLHANKTYTELRYEAIPTRATKIE